MILFLLSTTVLQAEIDLNGFWTVRDSEPRVFLFFTPQGDCYILYCDRAEGSEHWLRREEWYWSSQEVLIIQDYMGEFKPYYLTDDNLLSPTQWGDWQSPLIPQEKSTVEEYLNELISNEALEDFKSLEIGD